MRLVYVILHYLAGEDTIECANSILKSSQYSKHKTDIVIIDNGSPNNSLKRIKDAFLDNPHVKVIHSKENLGFSKGNNMGFSYAKSELNADFIVMLNNDTLITQSNFNDIIVEKFKKYSYSVLGPDILTADGFHQNPGNKQNWGSVELRKYRLKKRIRLILSYLGLDALINRIIESSKDIYLKEKQIGDIKDTVLHGACLIFSPLYIQKFEGLYPETFLYWEEDILKLQADYNDFLMMYTSDLSIFHKEDISTNMMEGSKGKKIRRKYKYLIESSKVYSKLKDNYKSDD